MLHPNEHGVHFSGAYLLDSIVITSFSLIQLPALKNARKTLTKLLIVSTTEMTSQQKLLLTLLICLMSN